MEDNRTCQYCNTQFRRIGLMSQARWERRKFCSTACGSKGKNSTHLKQFAFGKGSTVGIRTRFTGLTTSGKKNTNWKGDKASYTAKHIWVKNNFGSPKKCEFCGTDEDRMYHWANISQKYTRNRQDWFRLCVPCHKHFDNQKKMV